MLLATKLKREFTFKENGKEINLADPEPSWTEQQVMNFYANVYPILTTSKISLPEIVGDKIQFRFESVIGTKG